MSVVKQLSGTQLFLFVGDMTVYIAEKTRISYILISNDSRFVRSMDRGAVPSEQLLRIGGMCLPYPNQVEYLVSTLIAGSPGEPIPSRCTLLLPILASLYGYVATVYKNKLQTVLDRRQRKLDAKVTRVAKIH